jgi:RimJ/RimL family protein N-acetyltransferase
VAPVTELVTPRLRLRQWRAADLDPFAALNADPRVMEHFPAPLTRAESTVAIERIQAHFASEGFGLWAVEVIDQARFIGFTGLARPRFTAHFTPCIEIGWRLAAAAWGHGYATEAATAVVRLAFTHLALTELVSFTVPANQRSRRVMEKLGMRHTPADDFEHPALPVGHPLRRHVLYRLSQADWQSPAD